MTYASIYYYPSLFFPGSLGPGLIFLPKDQARYDMGVSEGGNWRSGLRKDTRTPLDRTVTPANRGGAKMEEFKVRKGEKKI